MTTKSFAADVIQESRNQPVLVDPLLLCRQHFTGAELLQHVVDAGEGEIGMCRLLLLAMCVEGFAEVANSCALVFARGGEGERKEACRVRPGRIVSNPETPARRTHEGPETM